MNPKGFRVEEFRALGCRIIFEPYNAKVTMAHQAPDSFMEFEGYFQLKSYRRLGFWTQALACAGGWGEQGGTLRLRLYTWCPRFCGLRVFIDL